MGEDKERQTKRPHRKGINTNRTAINRRLHAAAVDAILRDQAEADRAKLEQKWRDRASDVQ